VTKSYFLNFSEVSFWLCLWCLFSAVVASQEMETETTREEVG